MPPILDLLNLEYIEENIYRCCTVFDGGRRLYGGQVAAQALYAAGRTVPGGRLPHSLHGYFLRQGSTLRPTLLQVERDRDGQSFSARRVVAIQDGEVIFNMAASFATPRRGADLEAELVPESPAPDSLTRWTHPYHESFEFRTAQDGQRMPSQFWIRCTTELPDDPLLHAVITAYTSDISTGLIPLERDGSRAGPSVDHAVWFHRPARADEWSWQDLVPHTVAAGRGLYTGAIYSAAGSRIATIAQEQLFRELRTGASGLVPFGLRIKMEHVLVLCHASRHRPVHLRSRDHAGSGGEGGRGTRIRHLLRARAHPHPGQAGSGSSPHRRRNAARRPLHAHPRPVGRPGHRGGGHVADQAGHRGGPADRIRPDHAGQNDRHA